MLYFVFPALGSFGLFPVPANESGLSWQSIPRGYRCLKPLLPLGYLLRCNPRLTAVLAEHNFPEYVL